MAKAHIDALNARHASLDGMIADEMLRPIPDSTRVMQLKREKMKLKEEIARAHYRA